MTPSEVEKLAREAGIQRPELMHGSDLIALARFAELIERAAMEKAAKIADARVMGDNNREDEEARRCAAAIRAAAKEEA